MQYRNLFDSSLKLIRRRNLIRIRNLSSIEQHHNLQNPQFLSPSQIRGCQHLNFTKNHSFNFISLTSRQFSSESGQKALIRCWNCGITANSTPFLSCGSCRSVQPVDPSVDYFHIFGLEKRFDVLTENLESKYKDWQKKLHPDLVHSKTEREKAYAEEQSARVIDAYRTLSKPLLRALYLMKLEGVPVDEEGTVSDPELLGEMMEIREAIEEAADSQALKQIQTQIKEKLESCFNSFATAYMNKEFESAASWIQRMTYYDRAFEEIVRKL